MNLAVKKIHPCEIKVPPLGREEIEKYLIQLKTPWKVIDEKKITIEFAFQNFRKTMVFVKRAARLAEKNCHYPDIHICDNKVTIELQTHFINGLSENDFILASKIEALKLREGAGTNILKMSEVGSIILHLAFPVISFIFCFYLIFVLEQLGNQYSGLAILPSLIGVNLIVSWLGNLLMRKAEKLQKPKISDHFRQSLLLYALLVITVYLFVTEPGGRFNTPILVVLPFLVWFILFNAAYLSITAWRNRKFQPII